MKNPFRWNYYTTLKSEEEVAARIVELLETRRKVMFTSVKSYMGRMANNKFTITHQMIVPVEFAEMKIKGEIVPATPTVVKLKFSMPFLIMMIGFFTFIAGYGVYMVFTVDVMNINGVNREPSVGERIFFSLLVIAVPAIALFFNFFFPLLRLRGILEEKLQLDRGNATN